MAKFLNTTLLNEWIPRLINETAKELVIIVPYIKTSERIYNYLFEANKRGVETTLIYRENKLSQPERDKLSKLDNLNLMHHPNVHAKCYYNEKYLIIGSMNLYEYSELNNREMGVLLYTETQLGDEDEWAVGEIHADEDVVADAINEIKRIINGAQLEKKSRETIEGGFEMKIIKTERELMQERCAELNKFFVFKRFEIVEEFNELIPTCLNYFDNIDVAITHRAEIKLNYNDDRIKNVFEKFRPHNRLFKFNGYKLFWKKPENKIFLYPDRTKPIWQNNDGEIELQNFKNGIDEVVRFLRPFIN
ncbi:MAG TPA: phospholipase D family protein [Bacteroidia bacterium]|nr:phospholipase D family protein [Bacteroidia bacterium]HNU33641.1 phospholipase D family protein [Bacteroidia bacterium]